MDEKPTLSSTWHAMDYVSWSTEFCVKPTPKRWVQHKTRRP
jgi:hypothetical protein